MSDLADLSVDQITAVLKMYAQRTKIIAQNKKIDYILCFKNEGAKAGSSLTHTHSQILATEIVPEDLQEEAILAQRHMIKNGTCAYCDIIKKEISSSRKIINYKSSITNF